MSKIPMKEIKITYATGLASETPRDFVVSTWEAADKILNHRAFTDPNHGRAEKNDFVITFEDGQTRKGTVETRPGVHVSLAGHIETNANIFFSNDEDYARLRELADKDGSKLRNSRDHYAKYEYPFEINDLADEPVSGSQFAP